jgi:hypothetical protein
MVIDFGPPRAGGPFVALVARHMHLSKRQAGIVGDEGHLLAADFPLLLRLEDDRAAPASDLDAIDIDQLADLRLRDLAGRVGRRARLAVRCDVRASVARRRLRWPQACRARQQHDY